MSYLPRSRNRSGLWRKAAYLAAIFLAVAAFFYFFGSSVVALASPFWRADSAVGSVLSKSTDFFRSRQYLIDQNAALTEKVSSLELELSALSLKADELGKIEELMNRKLDKTGVLASVLTRPPQSPYDLIVIDAGKSDGISAGERVLLPEGPEIGTVSEASAGFSKVRLYSTDGEKTDAVLERHDIPVTLEGQGAGGFKIVVPRETEVEIGDRVLSPSLDSALVAVVEDVEVAPTDAFKEVLARSPANIFSLRYVNVLP